MEGLKKKMTYQQMENHMKRNSVKNPSKVNVGKYARTLGYRVYKPMVEGKVLHFYVNELIIEDGQSTN